MKCGARCGAIGLVAYAAAIFVLVFMLIPSAWGQTRDDTPYGRPIFGVAVLCGNLEPTDPVGCEVVRTRESFPTIEACNAAMPGLLEQQLDAIVQRYPHATLQVQFVCRTQDGVYDS